MLTRLDFNVPLNERAEITDDTRIRRALPTIRHIAESGGKAVLASHLGRPKGAVVDAMRLRPVAARLQELVGRPVTLAPDCVGDTTEGIVARMNDGDIVLLENLRFHGGESKNETDFARRLARMGDVYVNDAFGTAHRTHASTVGVTEYFEKRAMGYLIEREIESLSLATDCPVHPYAAILGGAKVSSKIGVIDNLMSKVDSFIVGGGMAYTFLRAQGKEIGESLLEEDRLEIARSILDAAAAAGKTFLLPLDVVVARELSAETESKTVGVDDIEPGWMGVDVGPETVKLFTSEVARSKTVVWNGPVGVFEIERFATGTLAIAEALAQATDAGTMSIVGGGDSAAAVTQAGLADRMTHISTGGGASLMYLEGKPLPAIEALSDV